MDHTICFYTTSWGRCYIREYLDALEASDQELLGITLAKLNRMQVGLCHRYPLVKLVTGYAFKEIRPGGSNTARLFYVIHDGNMVMLLSGYTKKGQKLKPAELKLADNILSDFKTGKGTYEAFEF